MASDKAGYIPGIDGLRAMAVVSVILFHLRANVLPGGFSGVDVFFVISGYVVSRSLAQAQTTAFWRFAVEFYARRLLRIYPALVLCLLVTAFFQSLFIPGSWLSTTSDKTALAAFFGLSNFALLHYSDGYFSPRVEFNSFTHTWSLGVEEQFYLLFPAIFFLWRVTRHGTVGTRRLVNVLVVVLLVASLGFAAYQTPRQPDQAFYLLPSRYWQLACGAALFMLQQRYGGRAVSSGWLEVAALLGLGLIGGGFVGIDRQAFPFPWALLPVLGALLVLFAVTTATQHRPVVGRVLDNRLMVYVGKLSYSLYLWHWPVLVLWRWTVGLEDPVALAAAVIVTLLLSAASYHWVERPVRRHPTLLAWPAGKTVLTGVTTIAICMLASLAIFRLQPSLSLSVTRDTWNWYPYPESGVRPHNAGVAADGAGLTVRRLFVLGDSHADAYRAMFRSLHDETGVEVRQLSRAGCAVAGLLKNPGQGCVAFQNEMIAKVLAEARTGDAVFIASRRINIIGDQWGRFNQAQIEERQSGAEAEARRAEALREADEIVSRLEAGGLTVIIDAPKPVFRSPPFRCADWFNAANPVCQGGFREERDFLLARRQPVMDTLAQLQRLHPALVVWDPFFLLCPGRVCTTTDEGQPLFFDGDHLSGYGNRRVYPAFRTVLESVWRRVPESAR